MTDSDAGRTGQAQERMNVLPCEHRMQYADSGGTWCRTCGKTLTGNPLRKFERSPLPEGAEPPLPMEEIKRLAAINIGHGKPLPSRQDCDMLILLARGIAKAERSPLPAASSQLKQGAELTLQHALDYLHSRYGGIEAAMIIAQKKREVGAHASGALLAVEPSKEVLIKWCKENGDLPIQGLDWDDVLDFAYWWAAGACPSPGAQPPSDDIRKWVDDFGIAQDFDTEDGVKLIQAWEAERTSAVAPGTSNVYELIDKLTGPTGGWLDSPLALKTLLSERALAPAEVPHEKEG